MSLIKEVIYVQGGVGTSLEKLSQCHSDNVFIETIDKLFQMIHHECINELRLVGYEKSSIEVFFSYITI